MLRHRIIIAAIALVSTLMVSACSTYRPVDEAFHKVLTQPYRLDAGDKLRITVFGQTDLTNTYAIDKAGYIAFPLIGSVAARGRTPQELEASIAEQLKRGFVRDPDVSVEIDRYRPFFIMGEVGSPGQYTYVPGMTVQNAIAIAGGVVFANVAVLALCRRRLDLRWWDRRYARWGVPLLATVAAGLGVMVSLRSDHEHAHRHQQAIARQESGRQQTVFKKQNHKQDKIEHANHGRIGQRFEILSP